MFLSKIFKHTRARVLIALAGLTMVLGVGATISTVTSAQQNEVVETKAGTTAQEQDATLIQTNDERGWSFCTIHLWGCGYATDDVTSHTYTNADLEAYFTSKFGSRYTGTWAYQYKSGSRWAYNGSSGDYLIITNSTSGNYPVMNLYLPWWVSSCYIQMTNGNDGWLPNSGYGMNGSVGYHGYVKMYYNNQGQMFYSTAQNCTTTDFDAYNITINMRSSGGTDLGNFITNEARSSFDYYYPSTSPTKTGYTFSGNYYTDPTLKTTYTAKKPTADLTLYAKMNIVTAVITLDKQLGSGGSSSVTATFGDAMPTITPPARDGYTFGGYYSGIGGSGTKYYNADGTSAHDSDFISATTIYAKWTINNYVVTCRAVINGTVYPSDHATYGLGTQNIDYGGTLANGRDFNSDREFFLKWWGNYSDGVFSGEITTITSTCTVYGEYVDYSRSQNVYLVGTMTSGWSPDDAYKMYFDPTNSSENNYYYYIDVSTASANAEFKIFDEEHFDSGEGDPRYIGYLDKTKDYDTSAPNLIGDDQSVGGGGGNNIILKKIGAYRIIYNYRGTNDKSVCRISAAATFTVYFTDAGANWSRTNAYPYQHGTTDHASVEAWPGTQMTNSKTDVSFKGGKLYKHVFNAGNYYPTDIVFNCMTTSAAGVVGDTQTSDLVLGDGFGYFMSAGGGGGSSDYGAAMALAWDIREACGSYTKGGKTYTASICAIEPTAASGFLTRYAALSGSVKSDFDNATFHTYGGEWQYGTTPTADVKFKAIMEQLDTIVNPSLAKSLPGHLNSDSPLTATLWIVLGAGVAGLGAIGTAYFVSKKKKRHQA